MYTKRITSSSAIQRLITLQSSRHIIQSKNYHVISSSAAAAALSSSISSQHFSLRHHAVDHDIINSRSLLQQRPNTTTNALNNNNNHRPTITLTTSRSKSTAQPQYYENIPESDAFPSIIIGAEGRIEPQGSFAEAQAEYLSPHPPTVSTLTTKLLTANMGIVAHYYMDVELQGILSSISDTLPHHIAIADSLAMGDHAVRMARDHSITSIACLGVDFMSESVAAILHRQGFGHVPVYRATARSIGCSLAESAEREGYKAWLQKAATAAPRGRSDDGGALHVVYINTSLETKASSASVVPTITCTSSNVLKTLLQSSAQIPNLRLYYGPDTYMGRNLVSLLSTLLASPELWSDDRIKRELHPQHDRDTLARLRDSIDVYPNGNCVVHHMFGERVVDKVKKYYGDAFVTAHLEVPGEMFEIAMEKSLEGRGVVGSTSDILRFISKKVAEVAADGEAGVGGEVKRLRFILGTEAGMVTSIVRSVNEILKKTNGNKLVEVEIIFPVASEAMTPVDDDDDMSIVPGVTGGEGCSTAGGCATCPFMKMNDVEALEDVVDMVIEAKENGGNSQSEVVLKGHLPPDRLKGKLLNGVNAIDLGAEPILFMRDLMANGVLPEALVKKIGATAARRL